MRFREDRIQRFEFVPVGLREEKVHDRDEGDIETEKYKISLPRDAVDHDRSELDDGVVEDPVGRGRETGRLGSDANRCHFGRIQPCHAQPANLTTPVSLETFDGEESVESD